MQEFAGRRRPRDAAILEGVSTPGPSVSRPSKSGVPAAGLDPEPADGRTSPRAKDRRKAAPLAKIGMLLFAIGLVAIFADFVLFAAGRHDLPLWLNLTAMLAPVGLGLGLIGVVGENRAASPALAARRAAAKAADRK